MSFLKYLSVIFILALLPGSAHAQSQVRLCVMTSSTTCTPVTAAAPLPVTGGGGGGGAVTIADGADVTLGAKADAKNAATDTTPISAMSVFKQLSDYLHTLVTNSSAAIPAGTNVIGYTSADPCSQNAKTNLPISYQTTSSTQLIALSGTTKVYVCSLSLIASAATVFSVTGGTGTNCGTPAALIGTTSATHGLSLAANGGLTLGNGGGTVAVTGAGSELCIVQSGSGDLVGNLTYVQAP